MLDIQVKEADYGKYVNNTEFSGDKFTTGWTLPMEYNLTEEQFEQAFQRKYFGRLLFDERKGQKYSAWKGFVKGPFQIDAEYKNAAFSMAFAGGKKVEWEKDCGISKIAFDAIDGGMIHIQHQVYVHPNAEQKRLLEQYQHSKVAILIAGAEVASKVRDKQQDLFNAKNAEGESASEKTGTAKAANGMSAPGRDGDEVGAVMNASNANGTGDGASKEDLEKFKNGAAAKVRAHQARNQKSDQKRNAREPGKRARPGAH